MIQKQISKKCFVCDKENDPDEMKTNKATGLPVCKNCIHTEAERIAEQKALDSLAEDFTCGCI